MRGVWAVAAGEDLSNLGPHILASATKRYRQLTELAVSWYLEGRLPPGEDLELGLTDDAVALVASAPRCRRRFGARSRRNPLGFERGK